MKLNRYLLVFAKYEGELVFEPKECEYCRARDQLVTIQLDFISLIQLDFISLILLC